MPGLSGLMRLKRAAAVFVVVSSLLSLLTYVSFYVTQARGQVPLWSAKDRPYSRQTMIAPDGVLEERQWKRMQDLKDGCKTNRTLKTSLRRSHLSQLIVDDTHRLVYCYVPKVACTSWKKVMAALNGYPNQTGAALHKKNGNRVLKFLVDYPRDRIKFILKSYVKFMFVREPFERLLSAYKNKFVMGDKYIVNKYGPKIISLRTNTKDAPTRGADVTFVDFINYIIFLATHRGRFNEHWRSYESLCRPCDIKYDFIGHYETMAEDAMYILKRTGVKHLVSFPPFRRTDTAGKLLSYYSQLPSNALLQLRRIYQADLDMFGYRFPGPLADLFRTRAVEVRK